MLELQLSASVVNSTPIDYVITVPAIWSEATKEKAKNAADLAGFKARNGGRPLFVVSAPVSAAKPIFPPIKSNSAAHQHGTIGSSSRLQLLSARLGDARCR